MPSWTTKNFQLAELNTLNRFICLGALTLCSGTFSFSIYAAERLAKINEYTAKYDVLRKGKRYGYASLSLKKLNEEQCQLKYQSEVEWMIFSDERKEQSTFYCQKHSVSPIEYKMKRTGTGSDKDYQLTFDHDKKQVFHNNDKYPLKIDWNDTQQDTLSYQLILQQDLKKGLTEFEYQLISKKGRIKHYKFKVVGQETITLPIGNVEAIRVKRLYDNDKRQLRLWFAPEMNYLMVRTWKGEKDVEKFDVQLSSLK